MTTPKKLTLAEFIDKIDTYERREKIEKFSGLGAMYDYLDDMGAWTRFRMWMLVILYTRGEQRRGLRKAFHMYKSMKKAIKRGAGLPHADGY